MLLRDAKDSPRLIKAQEKVRKKVIAQLVRSRKAKMMSQGDISKITGIQRPNISRLETGNYNPTLDMIVRIADSMNLKVNITFTDK